MTRDDVRSYFAALAVYLTLDALWLGLIAYSFYRTEMGPLLRPDVNVAVAGIFYLGYVVGVIVFAVRPARRAGSWRNAAGLGALLGLIAYGTYDLTNLAILQGYTATVAFVDLGWGVFVSTATALAGYAASRVPLRDMPPVL